MSYTKDNDRCPCCGGPRRDDWGDIVRKSVGRPSKNFMVTIRVQVDRKADIEDVVANMDYSLVHDRIQDTEIVSVK